MPNPASGNPRTTLPLSPAERSRLYLRRFGRQRGTHRIRIRDEYVNGLVKRGYLGQTEVDDIQAVKQAVSLFLWDSLPKLSKEELRRLRRRQAAIRDHARRDKAKQ